MTTLPDTEGYDFKLRRVSDPIESAVGFLCSPQGDGIGFAYGESVFGSAPSTLNEGTGEANTGENVSHIVFSDLHAGGLGSKIAKDFQRTRYSVGVYTGDDNKITLQSQAAKVGGSIAGYRIMQVLPLVIPVVNILPAPANVTTTKANKGSIPQDGDTLYYRVTAVTPGGEGALSAEISRPEAAGTKTYGVLVNWNEVAGASGYRIYRGTESGQGNRVGEVVGQVIKKFNGKNQPHRFHDTASEATGPSLPIVPVAPVAAVQRVTLIMASNGVNTRVYKVDTDANGAHLPSYTPLAMHLTAGITGSEFPGALARGACCVFQNRVVIPGTNKNGAEPIRFLFYDETAKTDPAKGSTPWQIGGFGNIVHGHLAVADPKRLWIFNEHLGFWANDPFSASPEWNGPAPVGDAGHPVRRGRLFGGGEQYDTGVFVTTDEGMYKNVETESGPSARFDLVTRFGLPDPLNGTALYEHNAQLISNARNEILRISLTGADSVDPAKDGGFPPSLIGPVGEVISTGRHLYAMINSWSYGGYSQILESKTGDAWHQVWHSCSDIDSFNEHTVGAPSDDWDGSCMAVASRDATNNTAVWLYFNAGKPDDELWRLPLRSGNEPLHLVPGHTPVAKGMLVLPTVYTSERVVDKVWHWAQVDQTDDTVPHFATLELQYRVERPGKPETLWTTLGKITSSPNYDVYPGYFYATASLRRFMTSVALRRSVVSPGVALRCLIGRGDGGGPTPVFDKLVLTYSPTTPALRRWTYNTELAIKMRDHANRVMYADSAAVEAAKAYLISLATNSEPVVLTTPEGESVLVRLDLAPFIPKIYSTRRAALTAKLLVREFREFTVQIVATEERNINELGLLAPPSDP